MDFYGHYCDCFLNIRANEYVISSCTSDDSTLINLQTQRYGLDNYLYTVTSPDRSIDTFEVQTPGFVEDSFYVEQEGEYVLEIENLPFGCYHQSTFIVVKNDCPCINQDDISYDYRTICINNEVKHYLDITSNDLTDNRITGPISETITSAPNQQLTYEFLSFGEYTISSTSLDKNYFYNTYNPHIEAHECENLVTQNFDLLSLSQSITKIDLDTTFTHPHSSLSFSLPNDYNETIYIDENNYLNINSTSMSEDSIIVHVLDDEGNLSYHTLNFNKELLISNIESNSFNKIQLFPNPTSGKLNIIGLNTDDKIIMYDSSGQIIKKCTTEEDISELKPGLYIIQIFTSQGIYQEQIFKR